MWRQPFAIIPCVFLVPWQHKEDRQILCFLLTFLMYYKKQNNSSDYNLKLRLSVFGHQSFLLSESCLKCDPKYGIVVVRGGGFSLLVTIHWRHCTLYCLLYNTKPISQKLVVGVLFVLPPPLPPGPTLSKYSDEFLLTQHLSAENGGRSTCPADFLTDSNGVQNLSILQVIL